MTSMKQAIEQVLTGKRKPMRVPAIIEVAVPLASNVKGKTPGQQVYSILYAEAKKPDGLVVKVDRGTSPPKRAVDHVRDVRRWLLVAEFRVELALGLRVCAEQVAPMPLRVQPKREGSRRANGRARGTGGKSSHA